MPPDRHAPVPAIPQVHQGEHPGPDPADDRGAAAPAAAASITRRGAPRLPEGALQGNDCVPGDYGLRYRYMDMCFMFSMRGGVCALVLATKVTGPHEKRFLTWVY